MLTAFVAVFTAGLLLAAGIVVDGGRVLAARLAAIGTAQEAARAGAQALDLTVYRAQGRTVLNADQARQLARTYLTQAGARGSVTVTGARVTVTVTTTVRMRLVQLAGVGTITVHGTGTADAVRGITGPDPPAGP